MAIEIVHNLSKVYTPSMTVAIGPTTRTVAGGRAALPVPVPTDANSIWLSKNGSDANPGTQALPKLTISAAVAAATIFPKLNVHIFRDGQDSEMLYTFTANITLSTQTIQAEEGETATLEAIGTCGVTLNNSKLNGLTIKSSDTTWNSVIGLNGGSLVTIENCAIIANQTLPMSNVGMGAVSVTGAGGTYRLERSVFSGFNTVILLFRDEIDIFQNNIVYAHDVLDNLTGFPRRSTRCLTIDDNGGPATIVDIDNTIFIGALAAIDGDSTLVSLLNTINVNNCMVHDTEHAFRFQNSGSNLRYLAITATNCLFQISQTLYIFQTPGGTLDSGITIVLTDIVDVRTPPMYHDYQGGKDGSAEGFRLQITGIPASNGTPYAFTSPLYDLGLGPWVEAVTGPVFTYADTCVLTYPPKSINVPEKLVNPVTQPDLRGNTHTFYDSIRRTFRLGWGDDRHVSTKMINQLAYVLQDRGTKKLYPRGVSGGTLYTGGAATGEWDATLKTFIPDTQTIPMDINHWKGFWIEIAAGPTVELYIESNIDTEFYCPFDKLGGGFPVTANYNFTIKYILVQNEPTEIQRNQSNFSYFEKGGRWTEVSNNDLSDYTWTTNDLVLLEVEDPEENSV